jgi:protein arginine phosphatase
MSARRILFVCTGNICRSAMAEHLLRHLAREKGLDLEVASAGVAAEGWYEMPASARRLMAEAGVPPFTHKARLLTREQLRWADLVLVMTRAHLEHVLELYPEFTRKTKMLREHAGFGPQDVEDPMSRPHEVFVSSLASIRECLDVLLGGSSSGRA